MDFYGGWKISFVSHLKAVHSEKPPSSVPVATTSESPSNISNNSNVGLLAEPRSDVESSQDSPLHKRTRLEQCQGQQLDFQ